MNQRQRLEITNGIHRRDFLRRAGLVGGGILLTPTILAACGSDESSDPSGSGGDGAGAIRLGTWVFYLDANDDSPQDSPTLQDFKSKTGIKVDYTVDVEDNNSFTAIVQPKLEANQSTGYDVVVLTSWMCDRWIRKGWAAELDDEQLPNKSNLLQRHQNPKWDPNRAHTLPYAEGQVGIAYYPDRVGFSIKSASDLLDPRLKGKVSILSEMRDSLGLFMLAAGTDPSVASVEEAKKSIDTIKAARDKGQFRKITGNSYTEDLDSGDTIAAIAWSGDVVALQENNPDLEWVVPDHGLMSFVDTMMIPKGAKNVKQAHAWMNYLYDPKVSAPLFEYISYVSPVEGATELMSDDARKSPLINPSKDTKIVEFRDLTETESDDLENAFAQATQL